MADWPLLKILIIGGLTLGLFAVGLGLRWDDFLRLFRQPGVALAGLVLQWTVLPLLALLVLLIWPLPAAWVLGIAILAASPGGPLSNLATYLGRGNGALSVGLTAVSTLLAPLTLPLMVALFLAVASLPDERIALPFAMMVKRLLVTLLLPVIAGMLVRQLLPKLADLLEKPLRWLAMGLFLVMFVHANWTYWDRFAGSIGELLPVALVLMGGGALMVGLVSRVQAFAAGDRMTLMLEVGIQNITTGLFIGEVLLQRPEVTVFNLVYGALIPLFALIVIGLHRWLYAGLSRGRHRQP